MEQHSRKRRANRRSKSSSRARTPPAGSIRVFRTNLNRRSNLSRSSLCRQGTIPAEFGQASGGLYNFTSRSGTNQYHGSSYEYFAHEKLNAARPFTNTATGPSRPQLRRHDLGANVGGPIVFRRSMTATTARFSSSITRCTGMYRPTSSVLAPFPRTHSVAAILGRFNRTTDRHGSARQSRDGKHDLRSADDSNGEWLHGARSVPGQHHSVEPVRSGSCEDPEPDPDAPERRPGEQLRAGVPISRRFRTIPSIKIDHNLTTNRPSWLGVLFASAHRQGQRPGRPARPDFGAPRPVHPLDTVRVNYDYTLTPTLIFHVGVGYQRYYNPDSSPNNILEYDPVAGLGLTGGFGSGFPRFTGLIGGQAAWVWTSVPTNRMTYIQDKPLATANMTLFAAITPTSSVASGSSRTSRTGEQPASQARTISHRSDRLPALQGVAIEGRQRRYAYASFLLGARKHVLRCPIRRILSIVDAPTPRSRRIPGKHP